MLSLRAMDNITSFRQLLVWQKSMDLAVRWYAAARKLPKGEQPVLGYQIRKSAVSIPSNIAEGFSRHSTAFYIQHLWTSHASGAELETQVELGRRLDFIGAEEGGILIADTMEVARMINGLVRSLQRSSRY
jgi:four helix bundle protein